MQNRIANVVRRFNFHEWGGTETVIWNTTRQLKQRGHAPEILATSALDQPGDQLVEEIMIRRYPYFYPNLNLTAEQVRHLDKKGGNPLSFRLYAALRLNRYRLIHAHTPQRIAAVSLMAARLRRIPFVISLHGGYHNVPAAELADFSLSTRNSLPYGRLVDILIAPDKVLHNADGIICVGYDEYRLTCERYPSKLVRYLPNGVNVERFRLAPEFNARQHFKLPLDKQLILCVSRIDPQKNQLQLLKLLDRIRHEKRFNMPHLVLVGPLTHLRYHDEIRNTIAQLQLQQHVTLLPPQRSDSDELINLYRCADLFILPSVHEPFGIVVLEAWAAGIPVIASNIGGLAHLVEDGRTALTFAPNDTASLYDAFCRLQQPRLRQALTATAMDSVSRDYSWSSATDRLECFYEDVERWFYRKGPITSSGVQ